MNALHTWTSRRTAALRSLLLWLCLVFAGAQSSLLADSLPTVSIDDVGVSEILGGSTNAVFTVTLSASNDLPVTVSFSTFNNTATAGGDFAFTNGDLIFPPGVTTQFVSVVVFGDMIYLEALFEQFTLRLTRIVNASCTNCSGTGYITNVIPPQLTATDVSVVEGDSGLTDLVFQFTLSSTLGQTVTVDYHTTNGTAQAGSDYLTTNGTLTFPPFQTNASLAIRVLGDTSIESDETLFLVLDNPVFATLPRTQIQGVIINDDTNETLTVAITSPGDFAQFYTPPGLIPITASAQGSAGIQRVNFYSGANYVLLGGADNPPFTFQWTNNIPGTYLLTAIATSTSGLLATSPPVHIMVLPCSGTLSATPMADQTLCVCEAVTWNARATSSDPLSFVWRANGRIIPGQTRSNLTLQSLKTSDAGIYTVEITSPCQSLTNRAVLTIQGDGLVNPLVIANSNLITINDYTTATPYPSTIEVRCVPGAMRKVVVNLVGLTHTSTHDIDILLANPFGKGLKLMSDVGRSAANANLTFSDAATASVPSFPGDIVSGLYKPTDSGVAADDSFPAGISYVTTLAGLNAATPNGVWSLYVRDDETLDTGRISGGWNMVIEWDDSAPRLAFPTNLASGAFQMMLASQSGRTHVIEASTDLHSWLPLSTNTMIGTNMPIAFPDPKSYAHRFFRVLRCPNL